MPLKDAIDLALRPIFRLLETKAGVDELSRLESRQQVRAAQAKPVDRLRWWGGVGDGRGEEERWCGACGCVREYGVGGKAGSLMGRGMREVTAGSGTLGRA